MLMLTTRKKDLVKGENNNDDVDVAGGEGEENKRARC